MSSITTPVEGSDSRAVAAHGHHDPNLQHHFATKEQQFDTVKLGIWLFLATEILMFGGLFAGFAYMQSRFPEAFYEGHKHLQQSLGAVNTVVLLISSFTMVMAVHKAATNKRKQLVGFLNVTILCAFVFLFVKYIEYMHKFHDGLYPGRFFSNPDDPTGHQFIFFSFYFMMTGLHGIHIAVGICILLWIRHRAKRGDFSSNYYTPVDVVGLYWHLVDIIWIYLFPLLYLIR
jgi:cytochrome c oxidase subunit III